LKKYKGIIKGSRTYDLSALSQVVDTIGPVLIMYQPDQLGVSVPAYMITRILINMAAAYLRAKTTGPVGHGARDNNDQ